MLDGLKVAVVLPAYNASNTLEQTYAEIPMEVVDDIILVDDASTDHTAAVAERLGIHTVIHARNGGYGANQKSCYTVALARGADIVVMVHPDYQYTPRLITAMAGMIASGHYDAVFGSRILGGDFVFDNEMIAQAMWAGFEIGEISCPTKYFPEASSINFRRSCIYGLGVLRTAITYRLCRFGLWSSGLFVAEAANLPKLVTEMPTMTVAEPLRRRRAA